MDKIALKIVIPNDFCLNFGSHVSFEVINQLRLNLIWPEFNMKLFGVTISYCDIVCSMFKVDIINDNILMTTLDNLLNKCEAFKEFCE